LYCGEDGEQAVCVAMEIEIRGVVGDDGEHRARGGAEQKQAYCEPIYVFAPER
jgi:hypothetical protein